MAGTTALGIEIGDGDLRVVRLAIEDASASVDGFAALARGDGDLADTVEQVIGALDVALEIPITIVDASETPIDESGRASLAAALASSGHSDVEFEEADDARRRATGPVDDADAGGPVEHLVDCDVPAELLAAHDLSLADLAAAAGAALGRLDLGFTEPVDPVPIVWTASAAAAGAAAAVAPADDDAAIEDAADPDESEAVGEAAVAEEVAEAPGEPEGDEGAAGSDGLAEEVAGNVGEADEDDDDELSAPRPELFKASVAMIVVLLFVGAISFALGAFDLERDEFAEQADEATVAEDEPTAVADTEAAGDDGADADTSAVDEAVDPAPGDPVAGDDEPQDDTDTEADDDTADDEADTDDAPKVAAVAAVTPTATDDDAADAADDDAADNDGAADDAADNDGAAGDAADTDDPADNDGAADDAADTDDAADDAADTDDAADADDAADTDELVPLDELPERGAVFVASEQKLYLRGPVTAAEGAVLEQRAIEVLGPDAVVNEYIYRPDAPPVTEGTVRIEQAVLFQTGSAVIAESFFPILELGVIVMTLNPQVTMVVEGHTDSVGPADSNQRLSVARAESVVRYLVGRGIDADRLTAVGLGETSPIADNETELGRQLNRRIEVDLLDLLSERADQ